MSRGAAIRVCDVCRKRAAFSVCLELEGRRRSLRCLDHTPAPGTREVHEHIWIADSPRHDDNYPVKQRVRWHTAPSAYGTIIGGSPGDPAYRRCFTVMWDGQPGLTTIHPSVLVRISPLEELARAADSEE